jgi:hypothetical protein
MPQEIEVPAVVREKTHVGKVDFPATVPVGLAALITLPDDLQTHATALGLDERAVKFLLGVLRGKCAMTAAPNLPDLAPRIGLTFDEIDEIVRGLLEKNYARFDDRLDLYRLWVVLLHLKGTRFVPGED